MFRQFIAVLVTLFCICTPCAAAESAANQVLNKGAAALRDQVMQMSAGAAVEVKFQRKGEKSLVGRLGPVTDSGFEIQAMKESSVSSQQLSFTDVKSVKERGKGMHPAAKAAIIAGVAVGAIALTAGILAGTGVLNQ